MILLRRLRVAAERLKNPLKSCCTLTARVGWQHGLIYLLSYQKTGNSHLNVEVKIIN